MLHQNLRKIIVRYENNKSNRISSDDNDTSYFVDLYDVKTMITALVKLHIDPGINPHNGKKGSSIKLILLAKPKIGNYWWTSANLDSNDKNGASIITFSDEKVIFASKKIVSTYTKHYISDMIDADGETRYNLACDGLSNDEIFAEIISMEKKEYDKYKSDMKTFVHSDYANLLTAIDFSTKFF